MRLTVILLTVLAGTSLGSRPASASPITWSAMGTIDTVIRDGNAPPPPLPGFVVAGLPWMLTFTFDPGTPDSQGICPGVGHYANAISDTRFQLGGFTYTYSQAADIFTNADLPATGCGGGGIVQFHWYGGQWLGDPGAPALSPSSLLIASYFDEQACNGTLPAVPGAFPTSCTGQLLALGGLAFWTQASFGDGFLSSTFAPQVVPEPATWVLIGSGLAFAAARRRRRRRA